MNYTAAKFHSCYGLRSQLITSDRMEIVFSGRSNVGKSSMINRLFGRKSLARTSSVPGKTATINFYSVDHVYFVDLPGYGYAKVGKSEKKRWSELIEGYFQSDRNIGLVILLLDIRHAPSVLDQRMIQFLIDCELPFILLLTKVDKLSANQQTIRMQQMQKEVPYADQITMIPFSSHTGMGVDQLRSLLNELCDPENAEA